MGSSTLKMRPSEAKSAVAYDPALDEYCLMYPIEWTFKQAKVQPCRITLRFEYDFANADQWQGFINHIRAYMRIGKLWLKTAGLQLTTYELNECLNFEYFSTTDAITIEFNCLYYDQYVKVNKDVRYETFKSFDG